MNRFLNPSFSTPCARPRAREAGIAARSSPTTTRPRPATWSISTTGATPAWPPPVWSRSGLTSSLFPSKPSSVTLPTSSLRTTRMSPLWFLRSLSRAKWSRPGWLEPMNREFPWFISTGNNHYEICSDPIIWFTITSMRGVETIHVVIV